MSVSPLPGRMTLLPLMACLVIALLASSAFAADPSLTGTYRSDKLTLILTGEDGKYTGSIQTGNDSMTVVAIQSGQVVSGAFKVNDNSFEFTAELQGKILTFKTGDRTYALTREATNPLAPPTVALPATKPVGPPLAATVPGVTVPATGPSGTQPAAGHRVKAVAVPTRNQRIAEVIEKAKAHLYARMQNNNWEESPVRQGMAIIDLKGGQWGGLTALSVYALLASGEKPTDPRLAPAIEFLRKADLQSTYAVALRSQIYQFLPQPLSKENKDALLRDANTLLNSCRKTGEDKGFYHYFFDDAGYDHSNAQYGVLGMWACQQVGVEVPAAYWQTVEDAWVRDQQMSGGWNYHPRVVDPAFRDATVNMTSAGLATLYITQDYLHSDTECKGNLENAHIDAGLKWMSEHIAQMKKQDVFYTYGLYGVSRIGVASGRKYFGKQDWFSLGADSLLQMQRPDGGFGNLFDTSFAILFLVRGRAPVAINKLEYAFDMHGDTPKPANWNERPRDVANITRWLSRQVEHDLNWQIVNLKVPVDELHDAPFLYISGNQAVTFSKEEETKLRQYVEEGGLIIGNADCASSAFNNGFRKLAKNLFPAYEFKDIAANDPMFQMPFPRSKWKNPFVAQGLSNGDRLLMVLIPNSDPARWWQSRAVGNHEESHQFMADLYLWFSDRQNLQYKGDTYIVRPTTNGATLKTIKVARLEYAGNWDPEPGGWRRMAAILHNDYQTDLQVERIKLGDGKLSGHQIAHLTGTFRFKLTDPQRKELKAFVESGGTLIVDAAGGSGEFASSAEVELSAMFGPDADKIKPLPLSHPVFTRAGLEEGDFHYRAYAQKTLGKLKGSRLRGLDADGKVSVFYSPEDLSLGMVGQPLEGIYGYTPQTATDIMAAMLVFAGGK